ncbi:SipW-dependent-type signal peptide-containing protein [Salinigranum salinum]|uniref:SipW-dependent-type signal peptide-containing protein n=1 Tax=Salinigranum salinum TaxID=1364937 RepID=UPI001260637A|nr:SipW-dependent-type signal peptide-containing protein [Salinigranum salinum]
MGTIGGAVALGGAGTTTFFSDTEEFANNELTARELDRKVAYSAQYSDWSPDEDGSDTSGDTTDDVDVVMWSGAPETTGTASDLPTLDAIQTGPVDRSAYGANLTTTHDYRDEKVLALSLQTGSVSGIDLEADIGNVTVMLTSGETLNLDLEPWRRSVRGTFSRPNPHRCPTAGRLRRGVP